MPGSWLSSVFSARESFLAASAKHMCVLFCLNVAFVFSCLSSGRAALGEAVRTWSLGAAGVVVVVDVEAGHARGSQGSE